MMFKFREMFRVRVPEYKIRENLVKASVELPQLPATHNVGAGYLRRELERQVRVKRASGQACHGLAVRETSGYIDLQLQKNLKIFDKYVHLLGFGKHV